ncbi:MAG: hypothetical protein PQJ50_11135 [Spirochaetales bacterium]|nr:hypothetical protein [Spirochaetales bacterium]
MKEHKEMRSTLAESLAIDAAYWALGRYFQGGAGPGRIPLWGLFILDQGKNLHFVSFNQENWFSSLMKTARSGSSSDGIGSSGAGSGTGSSDGGSTRGPQGSVKMHLIFPFEERESLVRIRKRGLFSFLQKSFPLYHLITKGETIVFELEDPDKEFLTALGPD